MLSVRDYDRRGVHSVCQLPLDILFHFDTRLTGSARMLHPRPLATA